MGGDCEATAIGSMAVLFTEQPFEQLVARSTSLPSVGKPTAPSGSGAIIFAVRDTKAICQKAYMSNSHTLHG